MGCKPGPHAPSFSDLRAIWQAADQASARLALLGSRPTWTIRLGSWGVAPGRVSSRSWATQEAVQQPAAGAQAQGHVRGATSSFPKLCRMRMAGRCTCAR